MNTCESSNSAPLLPGWMSGDTPHAADYWNRLGLLFFRNMAVLLVLLFLEPGGIWNIFIWDEPRWGWIYLIYIAVFIVQCVALNRWDRANLPKNPPPAAEETEQS